MRNVLAMQQWRLPHRVILWAGLVLTAYGFWSNAAWRSIQPSRLLEFAFIALAIVGLTAFAWMAGRRRFVAILAGTWLFALLYFSGLGPALAVVITVITAIGLGTLLVPEDEPARIPLALLAGLALICGVISWLLPFPMHSRLVYLVVAGSIIVFRFSAIASAIRPLGSKFLQAIDDAPMAGAATIMVLGIASTCAWLPTAQADDLSYHLALPWQLQELGYYRMDVASSFWAVSPWASDVIHAVAQLLGGEEARGAVNGMWLLLACTLIWRLCRQLQLPPVLGWLAVASYGSLPLTASMLAGMQTETASVAATLGLAVVIADSRTCSGRRLCLIAVLAGLLLAIKTSNAFILLPMGLWLLVQTRTRLPWASLLAAASLGLFVAASSYLYAWVLTGNPVLPFLNGIFKSPYFIQENWMHSVWLTGVDWRTPWTLMFDTSRYLTGKDGAAGMSLIVIMVGTILALRQRQSRALALVGLGTFVLVFWQIQYLRYVHPALALLIPAAIAGFHSLALRRETIVVVSIATAFNVLFLTCGYWQVHNGMLWTYLTKGRYEALHAFAPQRLVADTIRNRYRGTRQALFDGTTNTGSAELAGTAYTTAWPDRQMSHLARLADKDASGDKWTDLFQESGIELLAVDRGHLGPALAAALRKSDSHLVSSIKDFEIWEIQRQGIAPEIVAASGKFLKLRISSKSASRIDSSIQMSCETEGVPIVVSWSVRYKAGSPETLLKSRWAVCDRLHRAQIDQSFELAQPAAEFFITATPTKPMEFSLIQASATVGSDVAGKRDLSQAIRQPLLSLSGRLMPNP